MMRPCRWIASAPSRINAGFISMRAGGPPCDFITAMKSLAHLPMTINNFSNRALMQSLLSLGQPMLIAIRRQAG